MKEKQINKNKRKQERNSQSEKKDVILTGSSLKAFPYDFLCSVSLEVQPLRKRNTKSRSDQRKTRTLWGKIDQYTKGKIFSFYRFVRLHTVFGTLLKN